MKQLKLSDDQFDFVKAVIQQVPVTGQGAFFLVELYKVFGVERTAPVVETPAEEKK